MTDQPKNSTIIEQKTAGADGGKDSGCGSACGSGFLRSLGILAAIAAVAAVVASLSTGSVPPAPPSSEYRAEATSAVPESLPIKDAAQAQYPHPSPSSLSFEEQQPQAASTPSAAAAATPAAQVAPPISIDAAAKLKSDLVTLATTLNAVQEQMASSMKTAEDTRAEAMAALATSVAFTRLQSAINAGSPFGRELATMRQAAAQMPDALAALADMDALAARGAATTAMLAVEFSLLSGRAASAALSAEAKSWWEKLLAMLRSVITVRAVDAGGQAQAQGLAAVAMRIDRGDAEAASSLASALPEAARAVLAEWMGRLTDRIAVNAAMNALAERLVAAANPPSQGGTNASSAVVQ